MDYKDYWKAYRAKNRDKLNAYQRQRYANMKRDRSVGSLLEKHVKAIPDRQEVVDGANKTLVENGFKEIKLDETPGQSCCLCPSTKTKFHEGRKRWFCDVHRPGW